METLRRFFTSSSISEASQPDEASVQPQPELMTTPQSSRLLELPNEIIQQILKEVKPLALVELSATCRSLRSHAANDLLWAKFVQASLPIPATSPAPCQSWKELFVSHYPYWFLPRNKIWFSDKATVGNDLAGQLIIARYDPRRGCIEGYRLVAEFAHGHHTAERWEWNPSVLIHRFNPKLRLFYDNPVIKLDIGGLSASRRLHQEVLMQKEVDKSVHGIRSMLFLTKPIPPDLQDSSMSLWPPRILPAKNRVRNQSPTMFRGEGHKPQHHDEISDTTFRMRKWTEFRAIGGRTGVRMGDDVLTFSTLPEVCYTPTPDKPYQGIWVGDYAGHGCEFLVLIQKSVEEAQRTREMERSLSDSRSSSLVAVQDFDLAKDSYELGSSPKKSEDPPGCSGRLEAIKLTGDPNIPRGEYTWIAEDIGWRGLIRTADEPTFKGARIVKSWSHIAAQGFREDRYMPSQLILISHNALAMYWEDFGHVSFYTRVNIGDYLDPETYTHYLETAQETRRIITGGFAYSGDSALVGRMRSRHTESLGASDWSKAAVEEDAQAKAKPEVVKGSLRIPVAEHRAGWSVL